MLHCTSMQQRTPDACATAPGARRASVDPASASASASASAPSLMPDDDSVSICSDKCSQKTCSDCCGDDDCDDDCAKTCDGFVDCDDEFACTKPDCGIESCRDVAPPCFDVDCFQGLTQEEIDLAANLAMTSTIPSDSWHMTPFTSFLEDYDTHDSHFSFALQDAGKQHAPNAYSSSSLTTPPSEEFEAKNPNGTGATSFNKRRKVSHDFHEDYQFPNSGYQSTNHHNSAIGHNNTGYGDTDSFIDNGNMNDGLLHCQWGSHCDQEFYDWGALDSHIFSSHVKPQHEIMCQWDDCEEATDVTTIMTHVQKDHALNEDTHICLWSGCSAKFRQQHDLEKHIQEAHIAPIPIYCQWEHCGALADDPSDLSAHLQTDHFIDPSLMNLIGSDDGPSYTASLVGTCQWIEMDDTGSAEAPDAGKTLPCGLQFASIDALQHHVKEAHISALKKKSGFICQWAGCSRSGALPFSQKGKLERHIQVHTGFKACRCSICHKEFSAPQALQQHERMHTGEKPYRCETCGKEFAQGSALTMHKRTHTKERPLKCDFPGCNKTFSESSNLSKHKKTHNLIGQHHCTHPNCGKSFHRLDQLKRHSKTHDASRAKGSAGPVSSAATTAPVM